MTPMDPMDELLAYVGFTEADTARLRALWPFVEPEARAIADRFYATILRFPRATAVFEDMAQVERLKTTLVRWMSELCAGPHDRAYFELRQRIGRMHVKIRLPQQYMFTAMNLLREDLIRIARFDPETTLSILRITDIELAIMLGTYMDEQEHEKLASLRELIVSHLPMTVLVLDGRGHVVSTTDPHSRVLVGADLLGKSWRDVVAPALAKAADLEKRIQRATETRREIVLPRVDVVLDGVDCAYRVNIAPLDHPMAQTMIHVEDLTDVVASEARAKRAEHLAKLGMMAASVAHEIRNPLAGISGTVQVVQGTLPADDKRAVALQKVQEHIVRLGSLVGDLLSFSRPIHVHPRSLDLAVIAQAAASAEPTARVEGRGTAQGDAALLTQVLLNLIQNAAQAGGSQVRILIDGATMKVVDDGPGIPDDMRERVFEPFFTTKTRGTGLGLPIARKMVEAMSGTLSLCKSPLGGAGFELSLRPADD
jgi:signal transduction histidine kinase